MSDRAYTTALTIAVAVMVSLVMTTGCKTTTSAKIVESEKTPPPGLTLQMGDFYLVEVNLPPAERRAPQKNSDESLWGSFEAADWVAAEAQARKLLQQQPGTVDLLKKLSIAMAMQGKYHMAAFYAESTGEALGYDADLLTIIGTSLLLAEPESADMRHKALALLKSARKKSADNVTAAINCAFAELASGQLDDAVGTFKAALPRCDNCALAGIGLAAANVYQKDYKNADRVLSKLRGRDPKNPDVLYMLAVINLYGLKAKDKAEDYASEILDVVPESQKKIRAAAEALLKEIDKRD